jgi:phytoene desaturase
VRQIVVEAGNARGVVLQSGERMAADIVVSNADMHHTETQLLESQYRERSEKYWQKRTLAPSAFIMYLGIHDRVPELTHHNLLFAKDWAQNFGDIFDHPQFPKKPSVYVCAPSVTDPTVAPAGKENLFVLAPIAPGLDYTPEFLTEYGNKLLDWMGKEMGIANLRGRVEYRRDYCVKDFAADYNSYQGTALGLAHTLRQSVFLRPNNISKKVKDLYYVGAGTNPGIGMPICLISAELLIKRLQGIKTPEPLTKL